MVKYLLPLSQASRIQAYGTIMGWFEITQYNNNKEMKIKNLVETTWLDRYPWTTKTNYQWGLEFLGHDYKKVLIKEEYGIHNKLTTSGNYQSSYVIKMIHQVLANVIRTSKLENNYVDEDEPWKDILSVE